jgi:hypothetical protein
VKITTLEPIAMEETVSAVEAKSAVFSEALLSGADQ